MIQREILYAYPIVMKDRKLPYAGRAPETMGLWVGTSLIWKCNPEGKGMSFTRKKEAHLSSVLFDTSALTPKASPILARTLFNCQRAFMLGKEKDSINQAVRLNPHSYRKAT
jgi:hypothetical protein